MPKRDVMRDLREMNPVPHTAESALDTRAGADLHRILTGDLKPSATNLTVPGRRPGRRRARIGGLAIALAAMGTAGAYAATALNQSSVGPCGANAQTVCPPAKQAIQNQQEERLASRPVPPAKKDSAAGAAAAGAADSAMPADQPPTGIQDTQQGPFSPFDFQIQNEWQGPVQGNWVQVYAGEIRQGKDAANGHPGLRVYVYQGTWSGTQLSSTYYQVPGTTGGSAKITGQSNNVLTVVSSDGTQSKFDMTTNTVQ
jgi:hypothetical protein